MTKTLSPACILSLNRIITKDTQARAALSDTIVHEYAEAMKEGAEFPPIEVYYDDTTYWLADGFHRLAAAKQANRDTITATVRKGGKREALLHAVGANETHGLRRTNADRRNAVLILLNDPEWRLWNSRKIAQHCCVSHTLVSQIRRQVQPTEGKRVKEETRKVQRGGKVYTMRTGRIGSAKKKSPAEPQATAVVPPVSEVSKTVEEQERELPSVKDLQIDPHAAASVPAETPADVPPEPHADEPAPATHTEPTVTPERSAQPLVASEPQTESDAARPAAVIGQEPTTEPHARDAGSSDTPTGQEEAAHADGAPEPPSFLARTWDVATHEQRRVFVALRRDELQAFMSAPSSPEPAPPQAKPSAAPRGAKPQPPKQRRQRVSAQSPR